MDIDSPRPRRPEEGLKGRLELRVPIQNVGVRSVDCIETLVALGEPIGKPFGARIVVRAVDDMGNVMGRSKALGEKGSRADEDPSIEPGRRLSQGIREEHLVFSQAVSLSLMVAGRDSAPSYTAPP